LRKNPGQQGKAEDDAQGAIDGADVFLGRGSALHG
jgi:hypothetical protein